MDASDQPDVTGGAPPGGAPPSAEAREDVPPISVVVPAYNEAQRIEATLRRVTAYLDEHHPGAEVLVVDDGSTDETAEVVAALAGELACVELIRCDVNRGKGAVVREGVLRSRGALILFSDADLSTPIEDLERLMAAMGAGLPIAVGSRGLADSNLEKRQPIYREMMGRTFNLIVRGVLPLDVRDTQCGFKLFEREAARRLFGALRTEGFAFDVEILYRAVLAGFGIAEVPVTWRNDERTRVRPIRDASRMFLEVIAIRHKVRNDERAGRLLAAGA